MKHVAIDFHFVREYVHANQLHVLHVHSADQLADVLIKALRKQATPFTQAWCSSYYLQLAGENNDVISLADTPDHDHKTESRHTKVGS